VIVDIQGYLILRKPECNFDVLGRGAFLKQPPQILNIHYAGVDRMQWFDLDEHYYSNTLPSNLAEIRAKIFNQSDNPRDIRTLDSLEDCQLLLDFSNQDGVLNEIIAISCPQIESKNYSSSEIEMCIGTDIYFDGFGSMIHQGIFTKPEMFQDIIPYLNEYGLFQPNSIEINKYISKYTEISLKSGLEHFAGKAYLYNIYKLMSKAIRVV
jgi:hypothetical protein